MTTITSTCPASPSVSTAANTDDCVSLSTFSIRFDKKAVEDYRTPRRCRELLEGLI